MTNKNICKPQDMISNVSINVLGILTAVNFYVVLEEHRSYVGRSLQKHTFKIIGAKGT